MYTNRLYITKKFQNKHFSQDIEDWTVLIKVEERETLEVLLFLK